MPPWIFIDHIVSHLDTRISCAVNKKETIYMSPNKDSDSKEQDYIVHYKSFNAPLQI